MSVWELEKYYEKIKLSVNKYKKIPISECGLLGGFVWVEGGHQLSQEDTDFIFRVTPTLKIQAKCRSETLLTAWYTAGSHNVQDHKGRSHAVKTSTYTVQIHWS
jgi:hypothetical protein